MNCLLCSSQNVFVRETILKKDLVDFWKGYVDVSDEIKTDSVNNYCCNNCGLSFFDPQNAGGDKFYSKLGEEEWYYLHPGKTEYEYVQKVIRDNDYILDVGAGRGELHNRTKKKINYTGLELSSKAVLLAKEVGINVINEDLLIHSENNIGKYDIVCLFQVLEHLTELEHFISAINKCLKVGGKFCIAVPNNNGFISYTPNYIFNLPPHHTILWTEKSLRFLAKKFDFDVIEASPELLQDIHRENACQSYLISVGRKVLFLPNLLVDKSKGNRYISRVIGILFKWKLFKKIIIPLISKRIKYGQSIIVTLQKNKSSNN
jgi:SAM-dependent methyltransferase